MATQVPFKSIESRWARRWEEAGLHQTDLDHAATPFYNLMEFPYPSGEGLHVGHVMTYCGADAFGRLRRMQGYDVFQPMGFDAFGIHSENYALKLGIHPADLVPNNIATMHRQMERLGCQFDWSAEVDTTAPRYYRWTQWIFIQLYKAGLAYQAEAPVNWCPQDNTVLANEQV
ncbi:MAG: class I tRNA ligase family protein, partial [Anaerolineales bacterium]